MLISEPNLWSPDRQESHFPNLNSIKHASILFYQSLLVLHFLISNMIQKASDRAAVTQMPVKNINRKTVSSQKK